VELDALIIEAVFDCQTELEDKKLRENRENSRKVFSREIFSFYIMKLNYTLFYSY